MVQLPSSTKKITNNLFLPYTMKRRALPGQNLNFTGPNTTATNVPSIPQPQRRIDPANQPSQLIVPNPPLQSNQSIFNKYNKSKHNNRNRPRPSPRTEAIASSSSSKFQQSTLSNQRPNAPSTTSTKYGRGQRWKAPPRRRTFQLLATSKQEDQKNDDMEQQQQQHQRMKGGDDWFVDLSRRTPVFSTLDNNNNANPETSQSRPEDDNNATKNVHRSMNNAETTLGALRRNILLGKDYPPIINKYSHTRAAAIVEERTRHPVPARIGGLFSSFVGTLHLDYKKSIFQQIKTLRAVKLKKQQTSKLQWFGLPNATAEAGPPIRTAPVVEMTLSLKHRANGGKAPLLVYELLEEDGGVSINQTGNAKDGNNGRVSPATAKMIVSEYYKG